MNASRFHLEEALRAFAGALPNGATVLDAGAGDCRYASIFPNQRYEAADFAQVQKSYGQLNYVCDLSSIPVEDGRFDAIVCTQVLAHLPDPVRVLRELRRVLRPGGRLLVTAPLFFQENEPPYDFYRYTQFGLRHLFKEAAFDVVRLDWLEGYSATVAYQLGVAARALRASPSDFGGGLYGVAVAVLVGVSRPIFAAMSMVLNRADCRHRNTQSGQCKNYLAIVERPSVETAG